MDILFSNISYLILYNVQFSSWQNFVRFFLHWYERKYLLSCPNLGTGPPDYNKPATRCTAAFCHSRGRSIKVNQNRIPEIIKFWLAFAFREPLGQRELCINKNAGRTGWGVWLERVVLSTVVALRRSSPSWAPSPTRTHPLPHQPFTRPRSLQPPQPPLPRPVHCIYMFNTLPYRTSFTAVRFLQQNQLKAN